MADKRRPGRTKAPKAPAPVAYHIRVAVDLAGNFKYTADGIPDASYIRPKNGDTITWSVTLAGMPVPFQVEFPEFSPFSQGVGVVRSLYQETQPLTVNVPSYYRGNQVFKYSVAISNGWSDDPVVEPVPSDGLFTDAVDVITLSIDGQDNLLVAPANATYPHGAVTWQWAVGSIPDDFMVTFTNPPAGWPLQTTSQNYLLALNMQNPGGPVAYAVQTLHIGLSNGNASLQIT